MWVQTPSALCLFRGLGSSLDLSEFPFPVLNDGNDKLSEGRAPASVRAAVGGSSVVGVAPKFMFH